MVTTTRKVRKTRSPPLTDGERMIWFGKKKKSFVQRGIAYLFGFFLARSHMSWKILN
jgi:hypothetical protein